METRPILRGRWGIAEDLTDQVVTWQNGGQQIATVAQVFYRDSGAPGYMIRTTCGRVVNSGACRVIEHEPYLSDCSCGSCRRQAARRVRVLNAKPRKGSY